MDNPEDQKFDPEQYSDEPQIAQEDVVSAARSCSAILIIGIAVLLIACLALVLAKAF